MAKILKAFKAIDIHVHVYSGWYENVSTVCGF